MWQVATLAALLALMGGVSQLPHPGDPVNVLTGTGFVILAAFTVGELFRKIGLPALLGYIIAGLVFGPDILELVLGADSSIQLLPRNITDADQLAYIEILTIGVIGTLGGGELKIDHLKDQIGSILRLNVLAFLAVVPATGFAVYLLAGYAPDVVPFIFEVDQPVHSSRISASVLMGILGFAMSPAATLAIIQEIKAEGRYTSLVLGTVIVAELLLVAVFLLGKSFSKILLEQGSVGLNPLLAALPGIGAEFGWALVIGAVVGLVFILYLRFVQREMIVFTVGAFFVASYACDQLHAEKLLAFITAGFIVQNFSKHGHDLIEALERISLPVFVIYFTLQAVDLNLAGIPKYAILIGILTAIRTLGLFGSINLAAKFGDWTIDEGEREYLWLSFFSRGSVDLVLVALLAKPGNVFLWGDQFQTVIMGVVVIHMIAGPPLLKFALDRVGETETTRDREAHEDELIEDDEEVRETERFLEAPLPEREFQGELGEHLQGLQSRLQELYRENFVDPARSHQESMARIHERIDGSIEDALDDLEEILRDVCRSDQPDLREAVEAIHTRHAELRRTLQPQIELIDDLGPIPVTPDRVDNFLEEVREAETFDQHIRVDWEPRMWESREEDPYVLRGLKLLRRARKGLLGPGERDVPVGQLWRFYIALSLPEYLSGAIATTSEESERYWLELAAQLRETDALFETSARSLARLLEQMEEGDATDPEAELGRGDSESSLVDHAPATSMPTSASGAIYPSMEDLPLPDSLDEAPNFEHLEFLDADDVEGDSEDLVNSPNRCLEHVDRVRDEFEARDERLEMAEMSFRNRLLDRLAIALENAFSDFIYGVERAGTIELPGFWYRPSRRFDRARRAEQRLDERLRRGADIIAGCQGWIVAEQHLTLFLHWFHDYRGRVESMLARTLQENGVRQLRNLASRCSERPGSPEDVSAPEDSESSSALEAAEPEWSSWLDEQILPSVQRTREALNRALRRISQGEATQRLIDVLEKRVTRFPIDLTMLEEWPTEEKIPSGEVELRSVPLRQWFMRELIRETALRFVEMNERAEGTLRRTLVELEDIQEILVYNLRNHDAAPEADSSSARPDDPAETGLEEAERRLRDLADGLLESQRSINTWLDTELAETVAEANAPFFAKQLAEVQVEKGRSTDEKTQRTPAYSAVLEPFRRAWRRTQDSIVPAYRELREDLRSALTDERPTVTRSDVREWLLRESRESDTSIPVVYRRLFRPVPVDIPDFYIPRRDIEQQCREAADDWATGGRRSILLYGDRGTGKRTVTQHLLPTELFASDDREIEDHVETIRFGERPPDEQAICRALSPLVSGDDPRSFAALERTIHRRHVPQVACIEDLHSLFHQTPEGLERLERFLRFASRTSDDILWFFVVNRAAATYLDTALDLFDYFTDTIQVGSLETDEVERMIMTRHRVSGFNLQFISPETRLSDRFRHPVSAAEATRHPRRAYFDRLARLSRGNPTLALIYWLESIRPDPSDETRFRVDPLPKQNIDPLRTLSTEQRLVVASLIRHEHASIEELTDVFGMPPTNMSVQLEHLRRLGFVEQAPAPEQTYRLRQLAEGLVTPELRDSNLI